MYTYHPIAIDWLALVIDKFIIVQDVSDNLSTPSTHNDINIVFEINLKLYIPLQSTNPASIHSIMYNNAKTIIKLHGKGKEKYENSQINNHMISNPPIQTVITSSSSISTKTF